MTQIKSQKLSWLHIPVEHVCYCLLRNQTWQWHIFTIGDRIRQMMSNQLNYQQCSRSIQSTQSHGHVTVYRDFLWQCYGVTNDSIELTAVAAAADTAQPLQPYACLSSAVELWINHHTRLITWWTPQDVTWGARWAPTTESRDSRLRGWSGLVWSVCPRRASKPRERKVALVGCWAAVSDSPDVWVSSQHPQQPVAADSTRLDDVRCHSTACWCWCRTIVLKTIAT